MSEPRIVNGYCVATTFVLERIKYGNGGGEDFPDPRSKMVHAVKVTNGALATSQYRNDAVRSAGGEQLLGARLQVEVIQDDAWKDWVNRAGNRPELAKETHQFPQPSPGSGAPATISFTSPKLSRIPSLPRPHPKAHPTWSPLHRSSWSN